MTYKYLNLDDIFPNIVGTKCGNYWACNELEKAIIKKVEEVEHLSFEELVEFAFNFLKTRANVGVIVEKKEKYLSVSTILATVDSEVCNYLIGLY